MKRLSPAPALTRWQTNLEGLRQQRFFQDRLSLAILVPTLCLNLVTLLIMLLKLRPAGFEVPVRYSSLVGFDQLGPWYGTYRIGLFGLVVTLVNTTLAAMAFGSSRVTSFFLTTGAFVVALFCLIIGTAFAVIV
ncbi:MAG TPA: hypothetical protein VK963_03050 [Candidatus Saccharimonadales bacterium]|nr:hypothetical protein [Candidatus Saccharimonadales bacterium]